MNLTLHLTADCNLRCRYCYETHCKNHMTWDTAKQAVDLVFSYGHKTNGFPLFGGEPLLERSLAEKRSAATPKSRPKRAPWTFGSR